MVTREKLLAAVDLANNGYIPTAYMSAETKQLVAILIDEGVLDMTRELVHRPTTQPEFYRTPVIPRYFVRINNETVDQGSIRKAFPSEQAAAEFAWAEIRRGAYVSTYNDMNDKVTDWTYDAIIGGIVGQSEIRKPKLLPPRQ